MLCMLGSHHVDICKIFKINYASQLKSDWVRFQRQFVRQSVQKYVFIVVSGKRAEKQLNSSSQKVYEMFITFPLLLYRLMSSTLISIVPVDFIPLPLSTPSQAPRHVYRFLLSVGLPVANAPDVLQPCGLLYYP